MFDEVPHPQDSDVDFKASIDALVSLAVKHCFVFHAVGKVSIDFVKPTPALLGFVEYL